MPSALALPRDQIAALQGRDGLWSVPQLAELLRLGEERVREMVEKHGIRNRSGDKIAMYRWGDVLDARERDLAPPPPTCGSLPRESLGGRRGKGSKAA